MIVLTVGSQLSFDRLVSAVDTWCNSVGRTDVFAQIGDPGDEGYQPQMFRGHSFVAPSVLDDLIRHAEFIIAHAGMGSIISALKYRKPIVIMPRSFSLGEHRNDHQRATAIKFANRRGVYVADDETKLEGAIEKAVANGTGGKEALAPHADPTLLHALRSYILTGRTEEPRRAVEVEDFGPPLRLDIRPRKRDDRVA